MLITNAEDAQAQANGSPLLQETFTQATAPEFTGVGSACLTGAPSAAAPGPGDHPLAGCPDGVNSPPPDAAPLGYLRLTDASSDQSGAVLYNHALPAAQGLDVTFDQWQYGSTTPATPADGISFFLVNGDATLTHPGAFGGSLGYAQKLPDDDPGADFVPGVDRGYLGVGLDVLGNYFGDWEHRGNGCPPGGRSPAGTPFRIPAPGANMVTVRGPGDGIEGYCFLTATTSNFTTTGPWPSTLPGQLQGPLAALSPGLTPEQAQDALEPSRRRVHVEITPAPDPQLTVSIDFNDGGGSQQVLSTPAPTPVPDTYKFGFAASTGLFTDVHLVRNVVVKTFRPLPQLDLVKQARMPLPPDLTVGSQVLYDFVVTNSGGTAIDDLAVNDPKTGPVTCPVQGLAPGETVTCTATYTVTAADVAAGSIDNTATATGTSDGETITSPPSSQSVPIELAPGIEVQKAVQTPGPYSVGQTVTYTYTVRNTGGAQLTGIAVHDDHVTGITCQVTTLAPGDSTTCTGTYVIRPEDGTSGHVTNTATATGTADGRTVTSPQTYLTIEVGAPHISVAKRVESAGPYTVGSTVDYSYTVTNTGTLGLRDVHVQDDRVSSVTCDQTTLAAGGSTTCEGSYTVTQADIDACAQKAGGGTECAVTNVAHAAGTDPAGNPVVSAPAQATVLVEASCPPGKPCKPCKPGKPGKPGRPCKPGKPGRPGGHGHGYGGDTYGHGEPEGGTQAGHRW
ncbi:DUF7507 domain-containing protein [Streptomyces broussonetiae]|uniref:DUF7507 domain-containing protein n=1 Tax=Streptomyces broussonetiae TaxID=2686304 RepID=A0ABV5EDG9_9ACTN